MSGYSVHKHYVELKYHIFNMFLSSYKFILLTDAIFIWILQVMKNGGIYREYTCFL